MHKRRHRHRDEIDLKDVVEILDLILDNQEIIMSTITELQAAVQRNTDVGDSVVTLIEGIVQQLKDAQGNPAAIAELITKLDADTEKLSKAVTDNTPAEEETPTGETPQANSSFRRK